MATSSSRRRMVTGPGSPPATVHAAVSLLTRPTGVMTAAVPQANPSASSPAARAARNDAPRGRPPGAAPPLPLVGGDRFFDRLDAELRRQLEQRVAGDPGQ